MKLSKEIKKLIKERHKAREDKDWKKADILRKKINKSGWNVEDKKEEYILKRNHVDSLIHPKGGE